MQASSFTQFDPSRVPSPCFVIDEVAIERNLAVLADVQARSGAKVLAALKAFSCWSLAPLISRYLSGTCASGYHEAKLGHEVFGGEVHVFSAAFSQKEFDAVLPIADHIVLNSFSQLARFREQIEAQKVIKPTLSIGLRINPEHSEGTTAIYDPCAPGSRLGIPLSQFEGQSLDRVNGLHFHTLCEQGFEPLKRTLAAVEARFGHYLKQMQWVNFGGGHHISHPDYDAEGLIALIKEFSAKYQLQVYLEPGEAIAIRSGVLVSEVLDTPYTDRAHAILDTSATCHMPDTLEMPYRADIFQPGEEGSLAAQPNAQAHNYRLGGMTCLAGDVIGDYSFKQPLAVGDRLLFDDMAHYTMVKTTTFNGIGLPAIALWNSQTDALRVVREFGYEDFKGRLS